MFWLRKELKYLPLIKKIILYPIKVNNNIPNANHGLNKKTADIYFNFLFKRGNNLKILNYIQRALIQVYSVISCHPEYHRVIKLIQTVPQLFNFNFFLQWVRVFLTLKFKLIFTEFSNLKKNYKLVYITQQQSIKYLNMVTKEQINQLPKCNLKNKIKVYLLHLFTLHNSQIYLFKLSMYKWLG